MCLSGCFGEVAEELYSVIKRVNILGLNMLQPSCTKPFDLMNNSTEARYVETLPSKELNKITLHQDHGHGKRNEECGKGF